MLSSCQEFCGDNQKIFATNSSLYPKCIFPHFHIQANYPFCKNKRRERLSEEKRSPHTFR